MLQLKGVTKEYPVKGGKRKVLDGITANFASTGLVCVLGSSGCGKTTLLNLIGGLDGDFDGEILVDGKNVKEFNATGLDEYRNSRIGFVFQNSFLVGNMTVKENVELCLKLSNQKDGGKIDEILKKMGVFDVKAQYPHTLSGGEKQRVAIARAVVNSPDIILADEPTGALDGDNGRAVMELLKDLSKDRLIIVVTHNEALATEYAERILRLSDGKIISDSGDAVLSETPIAVPTKKGNLKVKDALKISAKNLRADKIRSTIVLFVQCVSVFALCFVLMISGWFNSYVGRIEKKLLYSYPIIAGQSVNYMQVLDNATKEDVKEVLSENKVHIDKTILDFYKNLMNVKELSPEYLDYVDNMDSELYHFKAYDYGYNLYSNIFTKVKDGSVDMTVSFDFMYGKVAGNNDMISAFMQFMNIFSVLPTNYGELISDCEIIGELPKNKTDLVLVVDENGYVKDYLMAMLGFYSVKELEDIFSGETVDFKDEWDYSEVLDKKYLFLNNDAVYAKSGSKFIQNTMFSTSIRDVEGEYPDGVNLQISTVIKHSKDNKSLLQPGIYYTGELEEYIFEQASGSKIVGEMKSVLDLNPQSFYDPFDLSTLSESEYKEVLRSVGGLKTPMTIKFFTSKLESKQKILDYLEKYNDLHQDDQVVINDGLGALMQMVTGVVNQCTSFGQTVAIIAFALVIIMTGVIAFDGARQKSTTFGIMRCIGARRRDVASIICFEYGIIGLTAGIIGVGLSYLIGLLYYVIAGLSPFYFIPVYLGAVIALAVCVINLLCALIPSLIILKNNPIKTVRQ